MAPTNGQDHKSGNNSKHPQDYRLEQPTGAAADRAAYIKKYCDDLVASGNNGYRQSFRGNSERESLIVPYSETLHARYSAGAVGAQPKRRKFGFKTKKSSSMCVGSGRGTSGRSGGRDGGATRYNDSAKK